VLDPVFNMGADYLEVLKEATRIGLGALMTFQSRLELIARPGGEAFLDLCTNLNAHLEFGLQTAVEAEFRAIKRPNNLQRVETALRAIRELGLAFETHLIYGLPNQTLESFQRSIDFLQSNGCHTILAYPLMLLKGTPLLDRAEDFGFVVNETEDFRIPHPVASASYSERDWHAMKEIAEGLSEDRRVFR